MATRTIHAITGYDHAGILAEQEVIEDASDVEPISDRYRSAHTRTVLYAIDVSADPDCYPAELDHVRRTVTAVGGCSRQRAHQIITRRIEVREVTEWPRRQET